MFARRLAFALALLLASPSFAQVASSDLSNGEEISTTTAASNGSWTLLLPSAPPPPSGPPSARMLHTAIYDPAGDRMVTFGGLSSWTAFHEVWAASLADGHWTALTPSGLPPSDRRDHIAVFDSQRNRMVIYGGSPATDAWDADTWALSLGGSPAWTALSTSNNPDGRFAHAGIYDPLRDRMIVFGGYTPAGFTNATWALDFSTNAWSSIPNAGDVPPARDAMTAIYDPVRDRMLVFGGWTGSAFDNRVWALSLSGTPTWSQVATLGTPPSARRHYGAAYDAAGDRLIILGGFDAALQYRNDAWALTLAGTPTWGSLAAVGPAPSPRNGQRAIYDPVRNRVVEFGGYGGSYLNDLWFLSLGATPTWAQFDPLAESAGAPGGLRDHVAVYDPLRLRLLVFGGSGYHDSFSNDTYALSLGSNPGWIHFNPAGARPAPRFSHAGIYDPVRDRFIVFGGYSGAFRNDVWALSLGGVQTWTQLFPDGAAPVGRDAMTAVYDPAKDRMLVFGGFTGPNTFFNDVWELTLAGTPVWRQLASSGTPPSPRRHYAAVWDPAGNRLVVTGGFDATGYVDDTWTLQFDEAGNATWNAQRPRGPSPSPRNGHRAVLDAANNRVLVFGGYDGGYRNDLWELSLNGRMTWHLLRSGPRDPEPTASLLGSFVADPVNQRFLQFGGVNINSALSDVWSFSFGQGNAVIQPISVVSRSGLGIQSVSAGGSIDVRFTLPDARPAEISLYSVTGRRLATREVGSLGAGEHQAAVGQGGRLRAGVYLVRLSNGVETRASKVVLGLGR